MTAKHFTGKTALISGAGSGIGLELAKELGRQGATIIGTDIDQSRLSSMLMELNNNGINAFSYQVNHADLSDVKAFVHTVRKDAGDIDILCCNAGVGHGGKIHNITLNDWKWVIDINMWGAIYMIHFFLPSMMERRQGHILITASGAGLSPLGGMAPYCMTKSALVTLTHNMRMELHMHNINVSALCPGIIKTNIMKNGRLEGDHNKAAAEEFYDAKGVDPSIVAKAAVKGLKKKKGIIPSPWFQVAFPNLLYRLSPSIIVGMNRILFKRGRNFLGPFLKD